MGVTVCCASGRREVRFIITSMSRSHQQFNALALPAASEPPTSVTAVRPQPGHPWAASTMVGIVVMSSSSMIRGLVRAT